MTISTDDFTLTRKRKQAKPVHLYNIEEDITTEKVTASVASTYRIRRSAILKAGNTTGSFSVFIGSQEWPAQISITTHLNKDTLHIHSKCGKVHF